MTLVVEGLAKSKFARVLKPMLGLNSTGDAPMKNSVAIALTALMIPLSAVANKIVTVKGQGTTTGYFEINDEWSLTHLKNVAKRDADKQAREKCAKFRGKPHFDLASYTSTCKPQPRFAG